MNTAILIIVFLYMICRNYGKNVSELNVLDILLIISIIGGFVFGISADRAKKKKQKEEPTVPQKPTALKESTLQKDITQTPTAPKGPTAQKSTITRYPDREVQDTRVYAQFEEMGSPHPLGKESQNTQVHSESVTEEFASESKVLSKTGAMADGIVSVFEKYSSVVLFDVETSGLSPYKDQIIELAAQRLYQKPDGLYAKEFHSYVNLYDEHQISREAEAANHISEAFLREKGVNIEVAISKFKEFIGDSALLVAHNANFDMLFVSAAALKAGCHSFFQSSDVIDTLTVFKDRAPYPHKLSDAIRYYKLEGTVKNSHSAIDDANALMEVFIRMAAEKDSLLQYVNLFGYNPKYPPEYRLENVEYFPQPYEPHSATLTRRFAPNQTSPSTAAVYNKSPIPLCDEPDTDNNTVTSQSTQDSGIPLSDEKIICEVSVYQTFLRGVEYAQSQRVKNIHFDKKRGLFKANTIGSQIYDTGIQITEQGDIAGYFCNCEAYKNYPRACKHIIALAKCIQQNWEQYYPAHSAPEPCHTMPCQKNQARYYPNPVTQPTLKQEKMEAVSPEEHKTESIPAVSVGMTVTHRFFGTGIVAKIDKRRITIKFPTESKMFLYPDVIQQGFLKVENGRGLSYRYDESRTAGANPDYWEIYKGSAPLKVTFTSAEAEPLSDAASMQGNPMDSKTYEDIPSKTDVDINEEQEHEEFLEHDPLSDTAVCSKCSSIVTTYWGKCPKCGGALLKNSPPKPRGFYTSTDDDGNPIEAGDCWGIPKYRGDSSKLSDEYSVDDFEY